MATKKVQAMQQDRMREKKRKGDRKRERATLGKLTPVGLGPINPDASWGGEGSRSEEIPNWFKTLQNDRNSWCEINLNLTASLHTVAARHLRTPKSAPATGTQLASYCNSGKEPPQPAARDEAWSASFQKESCFKVLLCGLGWLLELERKQTLKNASTFSHEPKPAAAEYVPSNGGCPFHLYE